MEKYIQYEKLRQCGMTNATMAYLREFYLKIEELPKKKYRSLDDDWEPTLQGPKTEVE